MKLLIVGDNSSLAEVTAELLYFMDRRAQQLEAITIALDLQTAIPTPPGHDAVLCKGMFLLSPHSRFVVEE
jgi:hypothetical protein